MRRRMIGYGILSVLLLSVLQPTVQPQQARPEDPWKQAGLTGKIDQYVSKVDGKTRGYAVCATSDSPTPKPLVVMVSPGASTDVGPVEVRVAEQYAWYAKKNGRDCVVLRSSGRGPGSVYQNYGELDVLEGIEDVIKKYPIDRDRISVIGSSMGGAATWYLVSHYPDLFAAGAPMSGYCDYRLWEKPGGFTFPLQPWEEPSWQARSAAFLIDNFEHTAMWIFHGEWDRSVGGGVPVEHSREMARLLKAKGFNVRYSELTKRGHSMPGSAMEEAVNWLIEQKKARQPKHVGLVTYELRHNKSYWVTIDQLAHYGQRASVDAELTNGTVVVKTKNIRALSIEQPDLTSVVLDNRTFSSASSGEAQSFHRDAKGQWVKGRANSMGQKHHSQSGPFYDIFFDDLILVPGTSGTDEETFHNKWMATNVRDLFMSENGGVHRGGIRGSNTVELLIKNDSELSDEQIRNKNLLLFGTDKSNSILARYISNLPLSFQKGVLGLGGRKFIGESVAVFAVFPHPDNGGRYIAVAGGLTPDAITWGSHLSYQLLPDYLVFDRGKALEWGFWDNAWKHPATVRVTQ